MLRHSETSSKSRIQEAGAVGVVESDAVVSSRRGVVSAVSFLRKPFKSRKQEGNAIRVVELEIIISRRQGIVQSVSFR